MGTYNNNSVLLDGEWARVEGPFDPKGIEHLLWNGSYPEAPNGEYHSSNVQQLFRKIVETHGLQLNHSVNEDGGTPVDR